MKLSRSLFARYLRTNVRTLGAGAGQTKCSNGAAHSAGAALSRHILRLAET
jgi:hypothetical protein